MGRKNEVVNKTFITPDGSKITKEVELFTWENLDLTDQLKENFS